MANNVVARFADGRVMKGTSLDIDPKRPRCHIRQADGTMTEVQLAELKALFFVKSTAGDPAREDARSIAPTDPRLRGSRLVEVTFVDGERIVALSTHYPPSQQFFFLAPVDAKGNNVRILVNQAHVESVHLLDPTRMSLRPRAARA
jgi:hypothetical protein